MEYDPGMDGRILVGTTGGLWEFDPAGSRSTDALAGKTITALALGKDEAALPQPPISRGGQAPSPKRPILRAWAVVDGRTLWARDGDGPWASVTSIEGPPATCLAPTAAGLLVGTEEAHLLRLKGGELVRVESFERTEGRETWYTPWGDPADVRSVAAEPAGACYVNVHVGGVVRSGDGARSWAPTLDIEADVHQVATHPSRRDVLLVAAAVGFGVSVDGGGSWQFVTAGLHGSYLRAVAVSEETVLVTASTGPAGRRAAIYRKPLAGGTAFERCRRGLPAWFDGNIDTGCLAASGPLVAFGTEDGRLFRSADGGGSWELLGKGLPAIRCIAFA